VEKDPVLIAIARLLKERAAVDISAFEPSCARRRVTARAHAAGCSDIRSYLGVLERNPEELLRLKRALHVTVSGFFRDPGMFRVLEGSILPEIFRTRAQQAQRRVHLVCVGCATGEEPYSLAITLLSSFAQEVTAFEVGVRGIDVETEALRVAREGIYPEDRIASVPAGLRLRYFDPVGDGEVRVADEVRKLVRFERRDIVRQPLPANTDLLLCRNTLIYYRQSQKEEILRRIVDALAPAAFLVLGRSEVIPQAARPFFTCVAVPERIYRKR